MKSVHRARSRLLLGLALLLASQLQACINWDRAKAVYCDQNAACSLWDSMVWDQGSWQ